LKSQNLWSTPRYRPALDYVDCLRSILRIHNETVNIWSHLLGFIFFTACLVRHLTSDTPKAADRIDHTSRTFQIFSYQKHFHALQEYFLKTVQASPSFGSHVTGPGSSFHFLPLTSESWPQHSPATLSSEHLTLSSFACSSPLLPFSSLEEGRGKVLPQSSPSLALLCMQWHPSCILQLFQKAKSLLNPLHGSFYLMSRPAWEFWSISFVFRRTSFPLALLTFGGRLTRFGMLSSSQACFPRTAWILKRRRELFAFERSTKASSMK